jgi:hypothetical protein
MQSVPVDPHLGEPVPFGALLRRYRLECKFSQESLADRARLSV